MAQIIDQIVKISIQDAIARVSTVDVNTVALVGLATKEGAKAGEFSDSKAVADAFGDSSELCKMADAFYGQDTQPNNVVCIPAGATVAATLENIKEAAEKFDFYHIVLATNDAEGENAFTISTDLSNFLAGSFKVLHVQVKNASSLIGKGDDRVAIYQHTENRDNGKEFLNVAIVALRCAADSARGTFAHKTCKGVTADSYSTTEYTTLVNGGINIYTTVSGEARLFMGSTKDKETFIDQIVKKDWVRFNVQSRIYKLLGEGNNGYGVNYDDAGIASVAATVMNVLTLAQDSTHQYIMADSANVDYKTYEYLKENNAEDVRKRNLPLITGTFALMNAIHTVNQVQLFVTL